MTDDLAVFSLALDVAKLNKIATTPRRDVSPADSLWYFDHPLRTALARRGVHTVGAVTGAVLEWLEQQP